MLPDLNAVYICPWDKTTAIIFADLFWEDSSLQCVSKTGIKKNHTRKIRRGLFRFAGIEPEFIVMKYNEKG